MVCLDSMAISPISISYTITWHALRTSMLLARERGETFAGFKQSRYASSEYFSQYLQGNWQPKTTKLANCLPVAVLRYLPVRCGRAHRRLT